ncbi:phosphopantetheine-binding protein, partial [Pseudozobellia sp. WGM2]|uniref:phosphopantetheine-binding protein n=1 Tax=Pseudozobellia sp. WGM2 TaxID=2787625 RepID=UPI002739C245
MAAIWQEVLGREKIGIKDDFFELGGHSLKMLRLVSAYHKGFDVRVDLSDLLFTHTSLESHAGLLARASRNEYFTIPSAPTSRD